MMGGIMATSDLANIAVIAALAAGVVLSAWLQLRTVKQALAPVRRSHARNGRRWRQ
jgi:hypothetical protein